MNKTIYTHLNTGTEDAVFQSVDPIPIYLCHPNAHNLV
jgi:hypothetical protein